MGYSLQVDTDTVVPIASNQGWADFSAWAATVDAPALRHLVEHGWTGAVKAVGDQLAAALKMRPPARPDVRSTAANLASVLREHKDAGVASVTDGMGP